MSNVSLLLLLSLWRWAATHTQAAQLVDNKAKFSKFLFISSATLQRNNTRQWSFAPGRGTSAVRLLVEDSRCHSNMKY